MSRSLFDCPDLALLPEGPRLRLLVATHPATSTVKPSVGVLRGDTVYELFLTTASPTALSCADVLDLYVHRGAFETVLADEDREQATDRWCSRTRWGQEFWQIVNQWRLPSAAGVRTAALAHRHACDGICPCAAGADRGHSCTVPAGADRGWSRSSPLPADHGTIR